MQRLRYKYNVETKLFESKPLFSNMAHIYVQYNNITLEYFLTNCDNDVIIKQGVCNTKQKMLRKIRKELNALGVVFNSEIRNKK